MIASRITMPWSWFCRIWSVKISVLRIRIPPIPINPNIALNPNGWLNSNNVGTAPISPSGAVANTMNITPNERTWNMITVNVSRIMIGNSAASATLALALSSTGPPMTI
eukprot:gene5106-biopygen5033